MYWANAPTRSDCYKIFAGDEANPSTSYVPGEYIKISIRTTCHDMLFRGMLLYAVDSNELKVGDWDLGADEPAIFTQPWRIPGVPLASVCTNSVMHYGAQFKSYLNTIKFIPPTNGTGKITFRCLIKYGDANVGAFYYPNLSGDLSLTQAAPTRSNMYELTNIGQSCSEFCQAKSKACYAAGMTSIQSDVSMDAAISPYYKCNYPILSGCGNDAGSFEKDNQYCYYWDTKCAAQNRTAANICDAKAADAAKFCVCADPSLVPGAITGDQVNSATSMKLSGLLVFLFSLLFGDRKSLILGSILFLGIFTEFSLGHNWINSRSRSPGASGLAPCKPPLTDLPHAQVGPNQPFSIEWMTAHGGVCYFVILHSKNQQMMAKHTTQLLEDYIKNAPNGSDYSKQPKWQRYHRMDRYSLDNNLTNVDDIPRTNVVNFYEKFIPKGDPAYIARPPEFGGRVGGQTNVHENNTWQVSYWPSNRTRDIRVEYKSDKYPWIESVARFELTSLQPVRPDVANFVIPGRDGAGRYIVQWLWTGYRDCIDVDFKPAVVDQVYGFRYNASTFKRIDHCMFKNHFQEARFYTEMVGDMSACLKQCEKDTFNCYGVNVVPLKAPPGVYPKFKMSPMQKYQYFYPNVYGADFYNIWNETIFNSNRDKLMANPTSDKYLCYGITPLSIISGTEEEFTTTNDPEDPIYYSTCYYKLNSNMFDDYLNKQSAEMDVVWRSNGKCIDCASKKKFSNPNIPPVWKTADICVNCDHEPAAAPKPATNQPVLVEMNAACDGTAAAYQRASHSNCTADVTCVKELMLLRNTLMNTNVEECRYMAANDPECGNHFTHLARNTNIQRCYCYKKNPCCLGCSRIAKMNYDIYEMSTLPDPNCGFGVKNTNGTACCTKSCPSCFDNANVQTAPGFCTATATRSCKVAGAPCLL
jgi:hypothetical protein